MGFTRFLKDSDPMGEVHNAHYLLHEIEEAKQLRKIQKEIGFDFMGKNFFKMEE